MKMKKIIIICSFLILILITAIGTVVYAYESYQFDMDPANGVDILEGFGAALIMTLGFLIVCYELDLFYTVYYIFTKPQKNAPKLILNILANLSFLLIFFANYYKHIFADDLIALAVVFATYVLLRVVASLIPNRKTNPK